MQGNWLKFNLKTKLNLQKCEEHGVVVGELSNPKFAGFYQKSCCTLIINPVRRSAILISEYKLNGTGIQEKKVIDFSSHLIFLGSHYSSLYIFTNLAIAFISIPLLDLSDG